MAVAGIILGVFGCFFTVALLMPAMRSARESARRSQYIGNLKQIGLAMVNYHDIHGSLPAAASTDENGKPLLSWRVAIPPLLECQSRYAKFHLDEPWDSPHNLSLLSEMPVIYEFSSDDTLKPGMTGYVAVVGLETAFTPDFKPLKFEDVTDVLDNTVLVAETRRGIPWTKPEDQPFNMALTLGGLGSHHGYHNNGLNAVFADDSVRFLKNSITPKALRAILTRTGGEIICAESY